MNLRNKKTGESGELYYCPDNACQFAISTKDPTDFIVNEPAEPLIKDTYIIEIISKAREWQKTESITTSSEVCKMLNAWADEYLEKEEQLTYSTHDNSLRNGTRMTRQIIFESESPDIIELRKEFEERFGSTEVFDNFYINLRNRIAKDTMKAMIEGQKHGKLIHEKVKASAEVIT